MWIGFVVDAEVGDDLRMWTDDVEGYTGNLER